MIEFLQGNLPFILLALVMTVLWFVLRTRSSRLTSPEEVDQLLSKGQPVVLKFFRNT